MKKLHFPALLVIALFLLLTPVYSQKSNLDDKQKSKLVGKWVVKITNSGKFADVEITKPGIEGTFQPINGASSPISNINFANGKFSFNVFQKKLKFESLTFIKNELKGVLIDGNAVGTTRKFAVVLTKYN